MSESNLSSLIKTCDIQTVTISVTEEIKKQFINEFLTTILETHNILCDENTYIWYKFINQINVYEIYVIDNESSHFIMESQILSTFYTKNKDYNKIDLFILKDFFVLYSDGQLYSFKSFKESNDEDIKNYVIQTYKIGLDNIYKIDNVEFQKLKVLYESELANKNSLNFVRLKKNNTFLIFKIFTSISIIVFLFIIYNTFDNKFYNLDSKLLDIQKKYTKLKHQSIDSLSHKQITPKLIELFKYIKLENITTTQIIYSKHKVQLGLRHKNKSKLLNFLTIYNGKIIIQKIEFLDDLEVHNMEIEVGI